jgi:undecaprenol kinase
MKNKAFLERILYAWSGISVGWRSEKSFRTQSVCFLLVVVVLLIERPQPVWWALLILTSGCVLSVELINTAIEKLADHLHPDIHPALKIVKDTLAGAILVMCVTAVLVFGAFVWSIIR